MDLLLGIKWNKYFEIYNSTDQTIDLSQYAFPNANNGAEISSANLA